LKTKARRLALCGAVAVAIAVPLAFTVGSAMAGSGTGATAAAVRAASPTSGWTAVSWNTGSYNVQNRTKVALNQRFTTSGGQFNINVHAGEQRVEMRWDDWSNQKVDNMWEADVLLDKGSTKTAIMQVKSNTDGEPAYIQVFNANGDLRNDADGSAIARGMYGKWFNLKVSFNPSTGVAHIWINDVLVKTRQYKKGGTHWYFKNGAYNNGLPSGGVTSVHFRDIKLWRHG
jgi:FlaG/FlaF family flagellin (archaellin)